MENNLQSEQMDGQSKRRSGAWKKILIGVLIVCFLFAGIVIGTGLYVARALQPTNYSEDEVIVSIPFGIGSRQISQILEQKGMIRDAFIFDYYLRWKKEGHQFKAGDYLMQPGMTLDQMIAMLNNGDTIRVKGIRLTIPEGYTVEQIANKLSQYNYGTKEEILDMINAYSIADLELPFDIPDIPDVKHRLEGYLFPETYELKKESTVADIISMLLEQTGKKLRLLPENWQEAMEERGLTFHQLLTIASLIEREAVLDEERPVISGVIYNRLRIGQPLQIDATVQYALDQPKERLFNTDLQVESPYNTYLRQGLPPGPIASPSLASIKAALFPEDTPYFYYVTKKDGSRGHLFAETYEQHRANIRESEQNAKRK